MYPVGTEAKMKDSALASIVLPHLTGLDGRHDIVETGNDFLIPGLFEPWEHGGLSTALTYKELKDSKTFDAEVNYRVAFDQKTGLWLGAGVTYREGPKLANDENFRLQGGIYLPIPGFQNSKLNLRGHVSEEDHKATLELVLPF